MDALDIPFTGTSLSGDDHEWNRLPCSTDDLWSSLTPTLLSSGQSFSHGWLTPELATMLANRSTPSHYEYPYRPSNYTMPAEVASGQDNRRSSALLDTWKWSPSLSLLTQCGMLSSESQPLLDGGLKGFHETFAFGHMPTERMPERPQEVFPIQSIPDLSWPPFSSMKYRPATLDGDFDHPPFYLSDTLPPSGSTQDIANVMDEYRQSPVVIYRPPEKKLSGRRRSQRPCAINIEGLWIDKDDLYPGSGHSSYMISIHECQWAKSSNPCGMWIIASRSGVGSHIRKWHTGHATRMANCLWDGCAKMMHKDSINRHVVSVHMDEAFRCQGCSHVCPRKDVYNRHVEESEACRGAGAAMVYRTESRVIDTRQALNRGGAVRYAGQ